MFKLTIFLVLLWSTSLLFIFDSLDNFFAWRHQLTLLTGFLSLSYMFTAALLAARFHWVESLIKGLDKSYALHKKLGIGATITLITHWLIINSPKWLIAADLMARPERGHRHKHLIEGINWHGIAEQVGDVAFKVFLIFSLISLVQAISYNKFKFTHKIAGILVLAGTFHGAFMMDWNIQSLAINISILIFALIGVYCAILSLTGKIGKHNKLDGQVISIEHLLNSKNKNIAIRLSIQLQSNLNYKEGQFAFLDFSDGEAPHPFSILNYDVEQKVVEFAIKYLGDYTNKLINNLTQGQKVKVEGCYGRFQISDHPRQVWIGAGIGIAPFVSRLYCLQNNVNQQTSGIEKIHLFYCVHSNAEAFFKSEMLKVISHLHFVELHIIYSEQQRLDSEQIIQKMKGQSFDVSFCGPVEFGDKLQNDLSLSDKLFHKEIFKMR